MSRRRYLESLISIAYTGLVSVLLVIWIASYYRAFELAWGRMWAVPALWCSEEGLIDIQRHALSLRFYRGAIGFGSLRWANGPYSTSDVKQPIPSSFTWSADEPRFLGWGDLVSPTSPDTLWPTLGFRMTRSDTKIALWRPWIRSEQSYMIPIWLLLLIAAIPAYRWHFSRERRIYLPKVGRCPTCGYDLRQSKTLCPECGSPIPYGGACPTTQCCRRPRRQIVCPHIIIPLPCRMRLHLSINLCPQRPICPSSPPSSFFQTPPSPTPSKVPQYPSSLTQKPRRAP